MYRYQLYTGPAFVGQWAAKFQAAGYANVLEGTQHLHFDSDADPFAIIPQVYERIGYLPSLRDIQTIRSA